MRFESLGDMDMVIEEREATQAALRPPAETGDEGIEDMKSGRYFMTIV